MIYKGEKNYEEDRCTCYGNADGYLPFAGCAKKEAANDDLSYVKDKGTLVIGITEYAPMNYYDDSGKLIGFDTEFAEAVCEKLGVAPEFTVIDWNTKEVELKAKI